MSENERLRQALRDMIELSMEDDSMWELHETSFQARRRAARNALAAKPETCVWDNIDRLVPIRSCRAHTRVKFSETLLFAVLDEAKRTDGILCPGCGRKIEVRE